MSKLYKFCLFFGVIIGVCLFATHAYAAPISGLSQILTQPDGTEITVLFHGDEIYSYMTDAENNVIVRNPTTGFYVYASLSEGAIVPTDYIYTGLSLLDAGSENTFLAAEDIPQDIYVEAYQNSRLYEESDDMELMSVDDKVVANEFNGMDINNLVVFIDFADIGIQEDFAFYNGLFNTNLDSAKEYYKEVSYGKLGVTSVFLTMNASKTSILPYEDGYRSNYYLGESYGDAYADKKAREQTLFKDALESISDQIPLDLELDKNNDGKIDMITFVLPGNAIAGENQIRWPHKTKFAEEYSITINGKVTDLYNVQIENTLYANSQETAQTGSAVICHETLHILGFPDMYYSGASRPDERVASLDDWDIMCASNGAHTTAYMKYRYGNWIDIPEITQNGTYTLKALNAGDMVNGEYAYMFRSPKSENEYFIVEYRRKNGEFETNLKAHENTLVFYRVLADHHGQGNVNAEIYNGADDELRCMKTKNSPGHYYPKLLDDTNSGIRISDVDISGATATFTISLPTDDNLECFRDKNLMNLLSTKLGKKWGNITIDDLQSIEELEIPEQTKYMTPYNLSGVENLTGLKKLVANDCGISDISMLFGLTGLEWLELNDNNITDISGIGSLTNLEVLKLRGNRIENYSPASSVYTSLTEKDFSLEDKNDAYFCVSNVNNGLMGTAKIELSSTVPNRVYYSIEKYSDDGVLLERERNESMKVWSERTISIPSDFIDDTNTYIVLKTYENQTYRNVMSETLVDSVIFDLGVFAD